VVGAQRIAYVSVGSEVVASEGWCVAVIRTPTLAQDGSPGHAAPHLPPSGVLKGPEGGAAVASEREAQPSGPNEHPASPPAQAARILRGLLRGEASRRGGHGG
jgi:hypothetical protein